MYRHKLSTFCDDASTNIYEFKVVSFQNDKIDMTIFQTEEFQIEILKNGEFEVKAKSLTLEGQWETNVNSFLRETKTKNITDLLETATTEFTNLPDMDDDLLSPTMMSDDLLSPTGAGDYYHSDEDLEALNPDDLIDSAIDTETTLKKQLQYKVLAAAQDRKMTEVKAKGHLDDIIESAKEQGLHTRDISKEDKVAEQFIPDPNVMQLYVHFFFDGFTIGHKEDMNEELELRHMEDEEQKPILNSLKAGYVPREFCGLAKEVDVHMIYKQCNFEDRFKKDESTPKSNPDEDDMEKVFIDGLGEFTHEEYEEQKRMLEEFEKMRKSESTKIDTKTLKISEMPSDKVMTKVEDQSLEDLDEESDEKIQKQVLKTTSSNEKEGQKLGQSSTQSGFRRRTDYNHTVDKNAKVTTIQFLFMEEGNSIRERVQFNTNTQLEVVYQHASNHFDLDQLLLTFSGKPLQDLDKTIEELKVTNSTIRVVRI